MCKIILKIYLKFPLPSRFYYYVVTKQMNITSITLLHFVFFIISRIVHSPVRCDFGPFLTPHFAVRFN